MMTLLYTDTVVTSLALSPGDTLTMAEEEEEEDITIGVTGMPGATAMGTGELS